MKESNKFLSVFVAVVLLVGVLSVAGLVDAKKIVVFGDDDNESEADDDNETEVEVEDNNSVNNGKRVSKEEISQRFINNNGEEIEIRMRVETKERNGEIEQKFKVRMSNGQDKDVKVLPATASARAIEQFQSRNVSVVLKEVGEGNNMSVVYEVDGNKSVRFLGLFKVRAQLRAVIDADSGEVLRLEKPWWYFMAFGKGRVGCDADNLDLCLSEGSCTNATGYWYNEICNVDEEIVLVCDVDNLDLCLSEGECTNVTGYWYNETCNAEAEVVLVCDVDNLDLCLDEVSCEDAAVNGTWDNETSVCS